jgi:2,4-dienoyl-CoA reductase-like NADH-dependent reductase (Old Yellow Enzyme family)/thioredoxin reductase
MSYTHVHTPLRILGVELRNRIVRTAHASNLGGGTVTDDLIAYHAARARGGVGLSIIETLAVHPSAPKTINIFAPGVDDGYRKMVELLRPLGMRSFQQLWHGGHNAHPVDGGAPWSASDIASPGYGAVPVPMTRAMIDTIIESFARAARKCELWGLDGVEINAAHGYLFSQFLSHNSNKREDDFGGSFENRCRLLVETLHAIRSTVSKDFPVGVRLSPEPITGGIGVEETSDVARQLEHLGLIDFLNVSLGNYQSLHKILGGMHEPAGYELPTSAVVTRAVSLPTIVTGRFRTLEEADDVIRRGDANLVSMVRALIADPDLVNKSLDGHADRVRPCIGCNQGCIGGVLKPPFRMGCAVNPAVGSELRMGDDRLIPPKSARKVIVVGGGPAGMEAARVSRLRGHEVALYEASPKLGGLVNIAARGPTRHGIADITNWLENEIFRLGVDIRLSVFVSAEDIVADAEQAVIVATGSLPRMDGIQLSNPGEPIRGMGRGHVLSSIDVLAGPQRSSSRAVVLDDVGQYEAVAVAERLIEQGCAVTYVTRLPAFAPHLESAFMGEPALARLSKGTFSVLTYTRAIEILDGAVIVAPTFLPPDSNQTRTIEADLVVVISHNRPNRDLFDALSGKPGDLWIVGDAEMPRTIQHAIRDGHLAGAAA